MCGGPCRPKSPLFQPNHSNGAAEIPTEEAKFISLYYTPLTALDREELLLEYLKDPEATHRLRASLKPFTNSEGGILDLFLTTSIVDLLMRPCLIDEKVDYFTLCFPAKGVKEALISYLSHFKEIRKPFSLQGEIVYSPMGDEKASARRYDIEVPSCWYSDAYFDKNGRLILTLVQGNDDPTMFHRGGDLLVPKSHKIMLCQVGDDFSSKITADGAVVI